MTEHQTLRVCLTESIIKLMLGACQHIKLGCFTVEFSMNVGSVEGNIIDTVDYPLFHKELTRLIE